MMLYAGDSRPWFRLSERSEDMPGAAEFSMPLDPHEVLTASPHAYLRQLVVTTSEAEVVITGRVPSYYLKHMAQEAIRACLGSRRLRNEVQVCSEGPGDREAVGVGRPTRVPDSTAAQKPAAPVTPAPPAPVTVELLALEQQFPPPDAAEVLDDARWLTEHWGTDALAPFRGTHVAVYRGAVVGSGDDSLQLELDLARRYNVHPARFVIEFIPPSGWHL